MFEKLIEYVFQKQPKGSVVTKIALQVLAIWNNHKDLTDSPGGNCVLYSKSILKKNLSF